MEPAGDETTDDETADGPLAVQFLTQRDCCLYRERLEAAATDGDTLCEQLRQLQASKASLSSLAASKLAKFVKKTLCKHADGRVVKLSRRLVRTWTELAEVDALERAATAAAASSSSSHPWLDVEDAVASVLRQCTVPSLLALKAAAAPWRARIRALASVPRWHAVGDGCEALDLSLALASGGAKRWTLCRALLLSSPRATLLCAWVPHDQRYDTLDTAPAAASPLNPTAVPTAVFEASAPKPTTCVNLRAAPSETAAGAATAAARPPPPPLPPGLFSRHLASPATRWLELAGVMHRALRGSQDREPAPLAVPISADLRGLETLNLARCALGAEGAAALAEGCACSATLRSLDLSSNGLGGGSGPPLKRLLRRNGSLTQLQLGGNALGDAGAAGVMEGLRLCPASALTSLDLGTNRLTARAAATISGAISDAILDASSGASSGTSSGASLPRATGCRLRSLGLASNSLGVEGARALGVGLAGRATLTSIDLADNQMRDEGMLCLGKALLESPTEHSRLCALRCDAFVLEEGSTSLSLTHKSLGRAAATLLAGIARRHARLTMLDLTRAYIGDEAGGRALARMLHTNTTLAFLGIDGGVLPLNELRGVMPLDELRDGPGATAAMPAPAKLDLSSRGFGPAAAHVLGSLLRANTSLTCLSLRGNRLGNAGAVALLNTLKGAAAALAPQHLPLKELDLRDNGPVHSGTAKALGLLLKLRLWVLSDTRYTRE